MEIAKKGHRPFGGYRIQTGSMAIVTPCTELKLGGCVGWVKPNFRTRRHIMFHQAADTCVGCHEEEKRPTDARPSGLNIELPSGALDHLPRPTGEVVAQ